MIQNRMFINHLGGVSKGIRAKSPPSQQPSPGQLDLSAGLPRLLTL